MGFGFWSCQPSKGQRLSMRLWLAVAVMWALDVTTACDARQPKTALILNSEFPLPEGVAVSDARIVGLDSLLLWNRSHGAVWLLAEGRLRPCTYDRYADLLSADGNVESLAIVDGVGGGVFRFRDGVLQGSTRIKAGRPVAGDRGYKGWVVAVASPLAPVIVISDDLGTERVIASIPARALAQDFGLDVGGDDVWLFSLAPPHWVGHSLIPATGEAHDTIALRPLKLGRELAGRRTTSALATDRGLVLTFADLASDERVVVGVCPSSEAAVLARIDAPIGFLDATDRVLFALLELNQPRILKYRWRWGESC